MFTISHLDHLVIRARDAEKLTAFYCDVLGCTRERDVPDFALIQLRAGASLIDIVAADGPIGIQGGPPPGESGGNVDHFCLRIEPFEEPQIRAHLATHGVEGSELRTLYGADGFGPSIYLKDPEGNTVELKGPPGPAPSASF
ncbi:MAG: VOC family protein [Pseudomonadota bacterium]